MASTHGNAEGITILVVDDEVGITESLMLLLEMEGYRVLVANHGKAALEQLATATCDLVVTDCMMPVMSGLTFTRELKGRLELSSIPVILMSAAPISDDLIAPAEAFLLKPFPIERLVQTIDRLLAAAS